MNLTSIKFPARWVDHIGKPHHDQAEFKLGPGPCGKSVSKLSYALCPDNGLRIRQAHDDGTAKDFLYQLRDITGRIEVAYS